MAIEGHLIRRGVEYVQQSGDKDISLADKISPWGVALMIITALLYYVMMFKIRYTLGSVVGTLAIVEEPTTEVVVAVDPLDEEGTNKKATDNLLEPEVMLIRSKPITSKIRTAIKHLKATGGRRGTFRGFSVWIVSAMLRNIASLVLASALPNHIGKALGLVVAHVLVAQLEMTWVHIVISEKSPLPWYKRIPSRKSWSKIVPVAAVRAIAQELSIGLPVAFASSFGTVEKIILDPTQELTHSEIHHACMIVLGVTVAALALTVLVFVPAHIAFVRVAASMLPDEDETIVPFDRTFGGKVTPAILGGSGHISMFEAWKTFSWEARRRFMGLMLKIAGIMIATTAFFSILITAEVFTFAKVPSVMGGLMGNPQH